jgi:DNA-directed RNA polymerase sigma subunit (sigma70/sigma32)
VIRHTLSLGTTTENEEDQVLGDFIEGNDSFPPGNTDTHNLLREPLGKVLNGLLRARRECRSFDTDFSMDKPIPLKKSEEKSV